MATLECQEDVTHTRHFVPLTKDEYNQGPTALQLESQYLCQICHGAMRAHWWGPTFQLDGQILYRRQLPPGTMYWESWHPAQCRFWDNCDGKHLHVILPNGIHWNIDGRASNCTLPQDRVHRCWIREGIPPYITVGKNGLTCSVGAGSIQVMNYHGFLRDGILT